MKYEYLKSGLLVSGVAMLCVASALGNHVLESWRVMSPKALSAPVLTDSVGATGKKYEAALLMDYKIVPDFKSDKSKVVSADTAGRIYFETVGKGNSMLLARTQLRAERFAKGKLQIITPAMFELFIDGKSAKKYTVVASDFENAQKIDVPLTLEPEKDVEVTIKLLANNDSLSSVPLVVEFIPEESFKDVKVLSGADMKRRFSVGDIEFGKRIAFTRLSADGNFLLYGMADKSDATTVSKEILVRDLRSGKERPLSTSHSYLWMPNSTLLYFTEKSPEGYNLFTINPVTMEQRLLYKGLPESKVYFNPTETKLFYQGVDEGPAEHGPMHRHLNADDRIPGNRDVQYIGEYDPALGMSRRLTFGAASSYLCDFHPDGTKLLLMTQRHRPTERPFAFNTLVELNTTDMTVDTIVASSPYINSANYSPDGSVLAIVGSAAAFDNLGKNSGSHEIVNDFDLQLYLLNRNDLSVKAVTKDFDPSIDGEALWNKKDGKIYFKANEGFYMNVYSYDVKTGKFERLPLNIENIRQFDMANAGTKISYFGQNAFKAGSGWIYDTRNHKNTLIADPLKERFDEIDMAQIEPWNFTASDGTTIEGLACYPPDYDATKKYPLIVYYYGGTTPQMFGVSNSYTPQIFASRDYMVYVLNPSGTIGYGQEFSARHVNAWGDYTADEIIEGVKKFAEAHPAVDKDKIGCLGASYGGFMTQFLQTKTDLFAAAVSHAGISNVTSYWGEGYWGYSYNSVAAADSYPWNNPDLFTKHGSLFNADKINTPLLLLHGTVDTNVPIGESIQIFNALKILGKEVEFISVEGENHVITDTEKRRLWQDTIMAWFARWLQDDPSWWNSLYGK